MNKKHKHQWAVNIDKLRVCLNMPENLYEYLHEHYSRYDEPSKSRILDEDDFNLVFIDEDEKTMTAVLNVRDVEGYFRLGTFIFNNGARYKGKAFFTFENSALYSIYAKMPNIAPQNHICDLLYVLDYYGMTFNNITEIELAFDSNYNYIRTILNWIIDIKNTDLYINGDKVEDDEILEGYGEFYSRNRIKRSKTPTLYFSHAKRTDLRMKIYNKAKELKENSPQKSERIKDWLGWDNINELYRIEVVLHNTNVREFMPRCKNALAEWSEHENVLNLLCVPDFRLLMFLDSIDRLIYFKDKKTDEKFSIIEVA